MLENIHMLAHHDVVGWLLGFYTLATSKVISGQIQICDSVHSWWLYSAAPLGDQAANTISLSHIIFTMSQPVLSLS